MFCPKCGKTISNNADFCQWCGKAVKDDIISSTENMNESSYTTKKFNTRPFIFVFVGILIFIGVLFGYNNILFGDDKVAYDLIVQVSGQFKDPTSVRLVSGTLGVDKDCLFCGINAKNGFGARGTSYYWISNSGYVLEEESPSSLYTSKSNLHINKINKALERHFGSD